ncbi:UNVERIFIED_CONTAM: hypothetical protein Sindi_1453400 [Sesamum indicum]
MINEQEDIVAEFVRYFEALLGGVHQERELNQEHLRSRAMHVLTEEEGDMLVTQVTRDDVKEAFFDIEEDKAPGPDGFSAGFYKTAWPIIGREVTNAILEFFHHCRLLKQINSTVIFLIPKVHNPLSVSDFRPISCCNVPYKVITKILVKRIRLMLDKLISPAQNAFVLGRRPNPKPNPFLLLPSYILMPTVSLSLSLSLKPPSMAAFHPFTAVNGGGFPKPKQWL